MLALNISGEWPKERFTVWCPPDRRRGL